MEFLRKSLGTRIFKPYSREAQLAWLASLAGLTRLAGRLAVILNDGKGWPMEAMRERTVPPPRSYHRRWVMWYNMLSA
mgnify:CR=1 FL=1